MSIETISAAQFANKRRQQTVDLIDVRTPVEFREVHVQGAKNVPLDSLNPQAIIAARNGSANEPLYVICRSGARGAKACQAFVDAGFTNIINVEGGTMQCIEEGIPVQRGKKAVSLERQVRIAAGLLVFTGSILGYFYPQWCALPAFVGAGLMFAGITDTCGMGMLLAKMPWNQVSGSTSETCSV